MVDSVHQILLFPSIQLSYQVVNSYGSRPGSLFLQQQGSGHCHRTFHQGIHVSGLIIVTSNMHPALRPRFDDALDDSQSEARDLAAVDSQRPNRQPAVDIWCTTTPDLLLTTNLHRLVRGKYESDTMDTMIPDHAKRQVADFRARHVRCLLALDQADYRQRAWPGLPVDTNMARHLQFQLQAT